jgi:hypothetical protein
VARPTPGADTNFNFRAEAGLKETYDSNVYLQDVVPNPANVAAAKAAGLQPVQADKSSWVTSILPKIGLDYKPSPAFGLSFGYAPDITFYHEASSENYVAHRGTLNLGGKVGSTAWELLNTATYIDGNDQGPTFARPGDIPAIGGIPMRDRRDAFLFRNAFRITQPVGDDWFIRPVANSYIYDFQTQQRYIPPALRTMYNYENYIDRQDISGGLDLGYKVADGTHFILGYRYGRQDQFKGPYGPGGTLIDSPFDSSYHRVLVGVEGSPANWLRINLLVGPDIRQFSDQSHQTYPSFNPDQLLCYLDASATVIPSKADTVTIKATRFEQPAFSSFSVYEDIKNDLLWRHTFNEHLSTTLGFTLYIGDWQPPTHRNDWLYTPNGAITYAFTKKLSGELAYSYDCVDSKVSKSVEPFTEGHEYTRHLASLGLKYTF